MWAKIIKVMRLVSDEYIHYNISVLFTALNKMSSIDMSQYRYEYHVWSPPFSILRNQAHRFKYLSVTDAEQNSYAYLT